VDAARVYRRAPLPNTLNEMVMELAGPYQRLAAAVIVQAVRDLYRWEERADARRFLGGAWAAMLAEGAFGALEREGWERRARGMMNAGRGTR